MKKINKMCEYGIFDGDELLARGSSNYLKDMFGIYVHQYVYSGKLFQHKYRVLKIGMFTGNEILSEKLHITKDKQEAINNAVVMMRLHGNLYANDPEDYRKVLEDHGISFSYRPCSDGVGYILERS